VFNGSLIAGGEFTLAGSTTVSHIARWDRAQWHALAGGVNAQVRTMAVWSNGFQDRLYVGGEFTQADGNPTPYLARWTGTRWEGVGEQLQGSPYAMAVYNGDLYIGGYFTGTAMGEVVSPYIIKLIPPQCCVADFNNSGTVSVQDIFDFLAAYFTGTDERADINGDTVISVQDIFDFLSRYFLGCTF
jgi:hypothetical protein